MKNGVKKSVFASCPNVRIDPPTFLNISDETRFFSDENILNGRNPAQI
ncbi:hypothetical protein [Chryseobacterium angstadtii]|nr:hypothetical protein [Chryseobacterium angstadtii]